MIGMRTLAVVAALVLAPAAHAADAPNDTCALMIGKTGGGEPEERAVPNLSVTEMTRSNEGRIRIDPIEGHEIVGFICDRNDIVPALDDIKVLIAGYKLWIRVPGREGKGVLSLGGTGIDYSWTGLVSDVTQDETGRLTRRIKELSLYVAQPGVPESESARAAGPTHDVCGLVMVPKNGGAEEERAAANLSVVAMTKPDKGNFSLPATDGYKLVGFVCDRDDIVPAPNDFKILIAGYRLYIRVAARHQKAVLYMYGPRLRYALIEGNTTPEESARVGPRLAGFMQWQIPPGGNWSHSDLAR